MTALYSENDPRAAAWLRELIAQGHIADGVVDERSIEDIQPDELSGFAQVHCFAGIGGWSYALRLAGWPDDRPVWTGSCPCQPFSAAGKRAGFADERHLWPAWFHLISQCRPDVVFGEQVAGPDGLVWFDLVSADLERAQYAVGAANLCAAGVGSPHRRQRLWFVAHANGGGERGRSGQEAGTAGGRQGEMEGPDGQRVRVFPGGDSPEIRPMAHANGGHAGDRGLQRGGEHRQQPQDGGVGELADSDGARSSIGSRSQGSGEWGRDSTQPCGAAGIRMEHTTGRRAGAVQQPGRGGGAEQSSPLGGVGESESERPGWGANHENGGRRERAFADPSPLGGFWASADWLPCTDGKARPVEPGTFPLAHGVPARVGRLRGYGNAINPWVAAAFIEAAGGVRG